MKNEKRERRRSTSAYKLDQKIETTCELFLSTGKSVSARSVAEHVGISPSSITRDPIRSRVIVDAKRQQALIVQTTKRQTKRSREKDAEEIARLKSELERLQRTNEALLYSHKALYNVIREIGGKDAWERFFATAEAVRLEISDIGGLDNN